MARVFKLSQLWRTTTVRLTALFLFIFVVFSVLLLGLIWWQTTVQLQKAQTDAIDRETAALVREWAVAGQVNILGGCCGSSPAHIAAMAREVAGLPGRAIPAMPVHTRLAGLEPFTMAA